MRHLVRGTGPSAEELISESHDTRDGKCRTAIVMPTSGDSEMVGRHLEALALQDFNEFDIIIVYAPGTGFVESPLNILHVQEKEDNGIAGAYYLGQKLAISEGYERIILADDDCVPESTALVGELLGKCHKEIVYPRVDYRPAASPLREDVVNHYCCIPRDALLKSGLTYLPLYAGSEEFDLRQRLLDSGFKSAYAEAGVFHPREMPTLACGFRKTYYYGRGTLIGLMLWGRWMRMVAATFFHLMIGVSYFTLGREGHARAVFSSAWDASGFRLFGSRSGFGEGKVLASGPEPDIIVREEPVEGPDAILQMEERSLQVILGRMSKGIASFLKPGHFNKRIVFDGIYKIRDLPLLLLAKSSFLERDGKNYLLSGERSPLRIIGGLLLVGMAIPLCAAAALALTMRGYFSKRATGADSRGYGID